MKKKLKDNADLPSPSSQAGDDTAYCQPFTIRGRRLVILIFIDWYLPGYKAGGPIQSVANLVAHLKDEFDFLIVTRDTDYCESEPYKNIVSNEWNTFPDGTRVWYYSRESLNRNNLRKLIQHTKFDVVYLNGVFSYYFTLLPLYFLRKKKGKRIVIATRGMLAQSALGVKKMKKQFFLRAIKVLKLFDEIVFHASTGNEKNDIRKVLGNKVRIKTAGNLPQKLILENFPERAKTKGALKLVNIARISPEKNLLYALKVLQKVKENVIFDFYGPIYNKEYWEECKSLIDEFPQNIKVSYKGSLESGKVLKEINNYHFMFMPTRGENFGHIILQALSAGCPVIISDQTPWRNLYQRNTGWDIPLEESEMFVKTINNCAQMDQEKYTKMSRAAFDYAKEYINNPETVEQNKHLFIV